MKRYSWLSNPLFGAASSSQATAPRNGGVTNEAVTSARMNCRPGMSVRDTSHPMGAATTQQKVADVAAMIAVVHSGSRKSGSGKSFTKFCSVKCRSRAVRLYTPSHDSGSTISSTRNAANSHSTGLVQSILARGVSVVVIRVMPLVSSKVQFSPVIAGLDPAIHHFERLLRRQMDTRVKPAYDEFLKQRLARVCHPKPETASHSAS